MPRAVAKATTARHATRARPCPLAPSARTVAEDRAIYRALGILAERLRKPGPKMDGTQAAKDYLTLRLSAEPVEHFVGLFLNSKHHLLADMTLSVGTLDAASVYPREVVKQALALHAGAVIFGHNHPSGDPTPSYADRTLTDRLRQALALVDIHVLDHIIVGGTAAISFAECGLMKSTRESLR